MMRASIVLAFGLVLLGSFEPSYSLICDSCDPLNPFGNSTCDGFCLNGIELCNSCFSQSGEPVTFRDALDEATASGGTLMNVEELRNLNDLSGYTPATSGDAFRVNAVFIDGAFRDPLTGIEVNFKSFPYFDPSGASEGDTLIFYPGTNSFGFASPSALFPALFSYPKLGTVASCPSTNSFVCSGGGNCIKGSCDCDHLFSGEACENVRFCPKSCNGFGECDNLSGRCNCPGFKGPACDLCWTGIEFVDGETFDCYIISKERMRFKEAMSYCGTLGLPMAEVHSSEDHENIVEKLKNKAQFLWVDSVFGWIGLPMAEVHSSEDHENIVEKLKNKAQFLWVDSVFGWIGATNMDTPGKPSWISTGETVNLQENGNENDFAKWAENEPRGITVLDDDDCVSIKSDTGEWHDTSCKRDDNFAVCQYRFTKIPYVPYTIHQEL